MQTTRYLIHGGATVLRFWLGFCLAGCTSAQGSVDVDSSESKGSGADGEGGAGGASAGRTRVTLQLEHRVEGVRLDESVTETPFTNAAGNAFGVTRLVYFLSDVTLTPSAGAPAVAAGAHYVDHEEPATRELELFLEEGVNGLESLSFVIGLPPEANESGAFATAPESLMEWPESMGGGYHYMKLEGFWVDDDGGTAPFKAHSGAAGGTDFSVPVELDASAVALGGEAVTLRLVMNIEQWFEAPNTWDFQEHFTPPMYGIMQNQASQRSLQENGATVFTLENP